jgi:hypothetical protein
MLNRILGPDGRIYLLGERGAVADGLPADAASIYKHAGEGCPDIDSSASMFEVP